MTARRSWNEKRAEVMSGPGAGAAYEAAKLRFELGAMVRERREAMGLTQQQLAEAAGMQQSAVARFEEGGTMPTILILERYARALDLKLTVELRPLDKAS